MILHNEIKKDHQIIKFCFYGFFKNLKFFEPYLIIYLIGLGLSLFQIGILYAIREAATYALEIPSGIFADHYGKKKELLLCFTFYIASFIALFIGQSFLLIALGMLLYGLGEAFRSGTHKGMILSYLEQKGWFSEKGFVYARTRSFSLLGSSLSGFISILFVLNLPSMRWIFLMSTIPYLFDFFLILSYPESLDEATQKHFKFKDFWQTSLKQLKTILKKRRLLGIVISASSYDAIFKTIKDYIQPIMGSLLVASSISIISDFTVDQQLKISLGILYGLFYILSSIVSRNSYRLTKKSSAETVFNKLYELMGVGLLLLGVALRQNMLIASILVFLSLYLMMDARRPIFVDVSSDYMTKEERVTTLSIESQFKSLFMIVFGPVFGFIADTWQISTLFLTLGVMVLVFGALLKRFNSDKVANAE